MTIIIYLIAFIAIAALAIRYHIKQRKELLDIASSFRENSRIALAPGRSGYLCDDCYSDAGMEE